jgi:hypothetical protein
MDRATSTVAATIAVYGLSSSGDLFEFILINSCALKTIITGCAVPTELNLIAIDFCPNRSRNWLPALGARIISCKLV